MPQRSFLAVGCLLCLASSCGRRGKPQAAVSEVNVASDVHTDRIVRGVFPGGTGWRWTAPVFAVALDPPRASKPDFLELDFTVPEELKLPVTVRGTVNGVEVARRVYDKAGRTLLACPVPASALTRRPAAVEFSVDRTCTDPGTSRVQGIIAVSVGLKEYEQTTEYRDAEMAKARQAFNHVVEQRNLQMPPEKQRELMKVFHELPIWESLWFQNVRIIKNPLDRATAATSPKENGYSHLCVGSAIP